MDRSIGELGEASGLRPSAIRYYESVGLLTPTGRVGGRRRYDDSARQRLAFIEVAKRAGFTLAEIRELFDGCEEGDVAPSARWRELAERKLTDVDRLLADVHEMRRLLLLGLERGCLRVEDCRLLAETEG
jgi:MerR family redox-sensitive transcriptional activator SoxR